MAPARHETPAAAGPSRETSTKTPSIYGTRSSKRKAGDISINGDSHNASSSPSQKSADASEQKLPPTKKTRRSSSNSIQQPVKTPESNTPTNNESQSPNLPGISEAPDLKVDGPSGSSANGDASPAKSVGWDDATLDPEGGATAQLDQQPTRGRGGRGRGGYRGRATKGKGRGGTRGKGRGGRGASAASGHNTPIVVVAPPAGVGRIFRGGRGGRGRGRVRKDTPRNVLSLYDRKHHLREQYLAIAQIQRNALLVLSDKSLARLQTDPRYHETLPEYAAVQNKLKQNYEKHSANLQQEKAKKNAYLERQKKQNDDYEHRKFALFVDEMLEEYETRIKEHALYIYHQGATSGKLDDIPFSGGEDGRIVKTLDPIQQMVPDVGLGCIAVPTKADPAAKSTEGDNYFEQHPANWWECKTPAQKRKWELDQESRKVQKLLRDSRGKPRKNKGGVAGSNPQPETVPTANKDDQSPESSDEDANANSPKPTGASGARADEQFDDDDAPAQPLDAMGFNVPRLSARHNNRIVGPPPVTYDEIEIGNRITKSKKDNPSHRYGQTPANPKKFYYDQNIHQCNAAQNDPEDFNQELVEKHNVHPKFGLPKPDSLNPDPPFNDWVAPLQDTKPVMFIQTPRPGTDRPREAFRTTRSQWMAKANRDFDIHIVNNAKMRDILAQSGDLELPPEPVEPEVPEVPQVIDPALIDAVGYAQTARQEELRQAAVAAHHAQFSPPPPPGRVNPPTPQRVNPPAPQRVNPPTPQRYDPVRDKTYRTPYAPVPQPPAPPAPAPRGELDSLAEAALIHQRHPAPLTYTMQSNGFGMPQLLPAPAPPQQYQSMYPPMGGQYQQPVAPAPRGPPPPTSGGSRHRELRPAPPQNRAPPPPPRGPWY
ncbi:hypothetical protein V8E51_004892 [Hyaloscypha variabilis]